MRHTNRCSLLFALFLLTGMLFAGCGGQPAPPENTAAPTPPPAQKIESPAPVAPVAPNTRPHPTTPPPMRPDNTKAADIEAAALANSLGLSPELTTKLADTYKAARESMREAMRGSRQPGQRPDFTKMRDVAQAEKDKFETNLKAFLSPEQAGKAASVLGQGGRFLDPMATALDTMRLEDATKAAAWNLVFEYVVSATDAMKEAASPNDFQALRDKAMKLKSDLDDGMAKILPADQAAKWKELTTPQFHPRGGQPGAQRGLNRPSLPAPVPAPQPEEKK